MRMNVVLPAHYVITSVTSAPHSVPVPFCPSSTTISELVNSPSSTVSENVPNVWSRRRHTRDKHDTLLALTRVIVG
jgi:hypothetical protein